MPTGIYQRPSILQRFWAKVQKGTDDECWIWMASRDLGGYGKFWDGSRLVGAHRFAYELLKKSILPSLEPDHLCRNTNCVNPAHLEIVTHRENTLRGVGPSAVCARKTTCIRGHILAGENLYIRLDGNKRECRSCRKITRTALARSAQEGGHHAQR